MNIIEYLPTYYTPSIVQRSGSNEEKENIAPVLKIHVVWGYIS